VYLGQVVSTYIPLAVRKDYGTDTFTVLWSKRIGTAGSQYKASTYDFNGVKLNSINVTVVDPSTNSLAGSSCVRINSYYYCQSYNLLQGGINNSALYITRYNQLGVAENVSIPNGYIVLTGSPGYVIYTDVDYNGNTYLTKAHMSDGSGTVIGENVIGFALVNTAFNVVSKVGIGEQGYAQLVDNYNGVQVYATSNQSRIYSGTQLQFEINGTQNTLYPYMIKTNSVLSYNSSGIALTNSTHRVSTTLTMNTSQSNRVFAELIPSANIENYAYTFYVGASSKECNGVIPDISPVSASCTFTGNDGDVQTCTQSITATNVTNGSDYAKPLSVNTIASNNGLSVPLVLGLSNPPYVLNVETMSNVSNVSEKKISIAYDALYNSSMYGSQDLSDRLGTSELTNNAVCSFAIFGVCISYTDSDCVGEWTRALYAGINSTHVQAYVQKCTEIGNTNQYTLLSTNGEIVSKTDPYIVATSINETVSGNVVYYYTYTALHNSTNSTETQLYNKLKGFVYVRVTDKIKTDYDTTTCSIYSTAKKGSYSCTDGTIVAIGNVTYGNDEYINLVDNSTSPTVNITFNIIALNPSIYKCKFRSAIKNVVNGQCSFTNVPVETTATLYVTGETGETQKYITIVGDYFNSQGYGSSTACKGKYTYDVIINPIYNKKIAFYIVDDQGYDLPNVTISTPSDACVTNDYGKCGIGTYVYDFETPFPVIISYMNVNKSVNFTIYDAYNIQSLIVSEALKQITFGIANAPVYSSNDTIMFFYALDRSKIIQEIINENIEDDPISSILDLVTHPYTISTVISFIIAILLIWASGSVLLSVVGLMASALLFSIFGMLPPEIAYVLILLAVGSLAAMIFFKR
jgi:hypothetical protein